MAPREAVYAKDFRKTRRIGGFHPFIIYTCKRPTAIGFDPRSSGGSVGGTLWARGMQPSLSFKGNDEQDPNQKSRNCCFLNNSVIFTRVVELLAGATCPRAW